MAITKYLNLITSAHSSKPNFTAWLSAALNKVDDGMSAANGLPSSFSVANAVGSQLDVLGQHVGVSRNLNTTLSTGSSTLDDTHFRLLLQATIAANQWDGTIPGLYSMWASVFPNSGIRITDNQNMTFSVSITGITDAVSEEMINDGLIIPKPMGVSISSINFSTVMTWNTLESDNATFDMLEKYTWDQLELSSSVN